jgi:hypothetical protein
MRIRMTETCSAIGQSYLKGSEYDVDEDRGAEFTRIGFAEEVTVQPTGDGAGKEAGDEGTDAQPPADPPAPAKPANKTAAKAAAKAAAK